MTDLKIIIRESPKNGSAETLKKTKNKHTHTQKKTTKNKTKQNKKKDNNDLFQNY